MRTRVSLALGVGAGGVGFAIGWALGVQSLGWLAGLLIGWWPAMLLGAASAWVFGIALPALVGRAFRRAW